MIRKSSFALLAALPALALAQPIPPIPGGAPMPPVSTPAGSGQLDLGPDAAPADAGASAVPPDTYTIRPGDTLWDLSGRFLNNPWYWPKIWSYNPEITNPHWIYPGNLLRFYPTAEEIPTRVEPVDQPIAAVEEDLVPVRELEDFSKADMKEPPSAEEQDAVAVSGPYKVGYVPPRTRMARRETFVTPRELAESGSITAAFEEKLMLSTLDRAYAWFENQAEVKPGETYLVFQTDRPVHHPETGELWGWQSSILGAAKVVAVDERAATLVVTESLYPIERGARLGPWTQKLLRPVPRKPNQQALEGRIIASQSEIVTQIGEHHVVFLDLGEADGVEEGNVLTVVRAGDPYGRDSRRPYWDSDLPPEDVGDLLVIDVKERASTALVTRSLRELVIGDRVEMRPEGGAGGH